MELNNITVEGAKAKITEITEQIENLRRLQRFAGLEEFERYETDINILEQRIQKYRAEIEEMKRSQEAATQSTLELEAAAKALADGIETLLDGLREVPGASDAAAEAARRLAKAQAEAAAMFAHLQPQRAPGLGETAKEAVAVVEEYRARIDQAAEWTRAATDRMVGFFQDLAVNGKKAFKNLIDSILADLLRLVTHKLFMQIFSTIIGGATGVPVGQIIGALGSAGTGGARGFASGGSFTVGGRGGTDQNLVRFRATRGETVTVTPKGQGSGVVIGATTININMMGGAGGDPAEQRRLANGIAREVERSVDERFRFHARPGGFLNPLGMQSARG
jgi:hypothetical protein